MGIVISLKGNNCYQHNNFPPSFAEISFKKTEEFCLLTVKNKDEVRHRKPAESGFS